MQEYALYKGDELLSIGTIREIAKEMGVKRETISFYLTPTRRKRVEKSKNPFNRRILVKLDDDE